MNNKTILKQLTKLVKYHYEPEILKPSEKFNLKPKPYKETLEYKRLQNQSRLEWTFGAIIAAFYFMNFQGFEYVYFPWCQPKEPKTI